MRKILFKTIKISLLFILLLFLLLFIGVLIPKEYYKANAKSYNNFIVKNCNIVDVENNRIRYNRQITVNNGIIVAIDSLNPTISSDTTEVINANGNFIMPTLWDMHVHTLSLSPQLHFPLLIANGVTNIRDMGDGDSWASDIDNNNVRDKALWEKMGIDENLLMPKIMEATSFHVEEVDDLNENNVSEKVTILVEKLVSRREPFIKVQLTEGDYPTHFFYELQKQAKQHNINMLGHLPADVNLDTVFNNGFKSVEHAWALIPHFVKNKKLTGSDIERKIYELENQDSTIANQFLELMKTQRVYYTPTHVTSNRKEYMAFESGFSNNPNNKYVENVQLILWKALNWLHTKGYDKEEDLPVLKKYYERGIEITNMAHKKGVKILAGTDALDRNVYYGISLHEELQELVKAGLTNAEALETATSNAAEYYGLSQEYGSIEVGKKSTFLLLEKNPLENIKNTQSINTVFFSNKLYNTSDLKNMKAYTMLQAKSYANSCKFIWNMIK
jgi:Amidohydrolase family